MLDTAFYGSLTASKLGILLAETPSKTWIQDLEDREVMAENTWQQSHHMSGAISLSQRVFYACTKTPPQSLPSVLFPESLYPWS